MKIERKNIPKMRIEHNRKLFWVIIVLLALLILLVIYLRGESKEGEDIVEDGECRIDSDCVPGGCCHSSTCGPKGEEIDCSGIACTAVCEPGTLDCGQGECKCQEGKCGAEIEGLIS